MKTILLIEDDSFLVEIYKTKLEEAGFSVTIANDGKEGLKKMREKMPDILILDIVLPNLNGWEILREIKGNDEFDGLKIIILSNLSQREEIEKGLDLGAVKYLVKANYTPSEVVEEVKKLLK